MTCRYNIDIMSGLIEKRIAERVKEAGGRTFYVGGYVRDRLLGIENKDIDIEVHGVVPEKLYDILSSLGEVLIYGNSFGVYALKGYDIDIAMPRKEKAIGRGHRDFEIDIDPFIGHKEAARRRDFTINSLMEDVLSGEIVDSFNGEDDLKKGIIRHIDDRSFVEDPLRVLRSCQFASRFGFEIAPETIELCRSIDITVLSRERVEEELKKAIVRGDKPSLFFEYLKKMDQLSYWFKEVKDLIGLKQDPIYHPEGDVFIHTMEVIDNGSRYRDKVSDPYLFMLLCLCHDFGKIVTSETINGRIHAYGHEKEGLPLVAEFLNRITSNAAVHRYVLNMVPLHMKPNAVAHAKSAVKVTNRMFDEAIEPLDLIYFSMSDTCRIMEGEEFDGDSDFLFERMKIYEEYMARPYVSGQDLIDNGLEPDESFSEILEYAHKLRLAGIGKPDALKQTLSYARKLGK